MDKENKNFEKYGKYHTLLEGFRIDICIKTSTLDEQEIIQPLLASQVFMKRPYFEDKFAKYEQFKTCLEQALKSVEEQYLRKFIKEQVLEKYGELDLSVK